MDADFQLIRQTTIFLLEPLTQAARAWAEDHVSADVTRFGPAIVIDDRYIADMLSGISTAGLTVDWFDIPVHDYVIVGSDTQDYTSLAATGAL